MIISGEDIVAGLVDLRQNLDDGSAYVEQQRALILAINLAINQFVLHRGSEPAPECADISFDNRIFEALLGVHLNLLHTLYEVQGDCIGPKWKLQQLPKFLYQQCIKITELEKKDVESKSNRSGDTAERLEEKGS